MKMRTPYLCAVLLSGCVTMRPLGVTAPPSLQQPAPEPAPAPVPEEDEGPRFFTPFPDDFLDEEPEARPC